METPDEKDLQSHESESDRDEKEDSPRAAKQVFSFVSNVRQAIRDLLGCVPRKQTEIALAQVELLHAKRVVYTI